MTKTFAAQLKGFADLSKKNQRYVAVNAIQDVMEAAMTPQLGITKGATGFVEGKIPVAESDLINSLQSNGAPGAESYVAVIGGMEVGEKLTFEWTSGHALPMELGFRTKNGKLVPGRHFVGANAARFQSFVTARAAEVRK